MPRRNESPREETTASASATSSLERSTIKSICASAMAALAAVWVASSAKAESTTIEGITITPDNGSIVEKEILDRYPLTGEPGKWLRVKVVKGVAGVCDKNDCTRLTDKLTGKQIIELDNLETLPTE